MASEIFPNEYHYDQETKWLHSGGVTVTCPDGGVGKLVFDILKKYSEQGLLYQVDLLGREESHEELLMKCIKVALYMKDQGLKPGDIISMCAKNIIENIVVLYASFFNGIILASTDPLMSVSDTKYLLDMVEPTLMFVCKDSIDVSTKATKDKGVKIVTLYENNSFDNLPEILEKYSEEDVKSFVPYYAEDLNEIISIQFSSGTTGMPKGSCINHYALFQHSNVKFPPGARCCMLSTLYWGATILVDLAVLQSGAIRVCINVSPETIWNDLKQTKSNLVIFSYGWCLQSIPYLKEPLPDLKSVLFIGGLVPLRYQNELKEKLPNTNFTNFYGSTELGCVSTNDGRAPLTSAGLLAPKDLILKIVDPDTEEALGLNMKGDIRIKGKHQLSGYYKMDSSDAWDAEGFFKMGDLGYLSDKFELFVVDRLKEMFKYRGYHVIPEKIEKVMLSHPAVKVAIVIPVHNMIDDSHARGLIILKDGCSATADELVKFTNDNIEDARNHLRAGVKIITDSDIVYTANRKINRRQLKQKFGK